MSPVASYIIETSVTLLAILVLAVLVLYGGRRLGLGKPSGPVELLGRLPLDARRAVYLVKVGKLVYVVGASEGGLTRLGEIDADQVPPLAPLLRSASFADVLARIVKPSSRRSGSGPATETGEQAGNHGP